MKLQPLRIHTIATPGNLLREDLTQIVSQHETLKLYHHELFRLCAENNGVGIAANQVGLRENFFFLMPGAKVPTKTNSSTVAHLCVNPSWTPAAGASEVDGEEGCMSLPGRLFIVRRFGEINASWTNAVGHKVSKRLKGWTARVFQHEYDHLRGVTLLQSGKEVRHGL